MHALITILMIAVYSWWSVIVGLVVLAIGGWPALGVFVFIHFVARFFESLKNNIVAEVSAEVKRK